MSKAKQREAALEIANRVRSERAAIRRNLASHKDKARSRALAAEYVADLPECLERATVGYLMQSIHRVGQAEQDRMLNALRLNPTKRLGSLTNRQRALLVIALDPTRNLRTGPYDRAALRELGLTHDQVVAVTRDHLEGRAA